MSVEVTSAVWALPPDAPISSGDRLVLLRLADVAHPDGSNAFLAVRTIADGVGLDRSSVQRCLRRLEEVGYLTVQHEATNRRPTIYRLTLGLRAVPEPVDVGPQNAAPAEAALGPRRGRVGAAPVRPDPDPDPEPPLLHTVPRARANPVLLNLEDLATSLVSLTLSGAQTDALAQFAEHLELDDVPRIRDAMNDSRAWPYLKGICSRVASDRRNGLDPWRVNDGNQQTAGGTGTARSGSQPGAHRGGSVGVGGARRDGVPRVPGFDSTGIRSLETLEDVDRAFGLAPGTSAAAAADGLPVPEV